MHDNISFDRQKTIERIAALDSYFKIRVMESNRFICSNFSACRKSHLGTFYKGQLHHIGSYYDAYLSNRPFRIIVVGQEYGHEPSFVSLSARRQMVLDQTGLHKTFSQRNPHMRGTTSVLRLLYGIPLGVDHPSEYLTVAAARQCHLFDAFALVNYLLCSAVSADEGRRGKSTATMRDNCLKHFRAVLDILEPNVVIVQGKKYWQWIERAFNHPTRLTDTLYRVGSGYGKVMIAVFAHPSTPDNKHNWGRDDKTPYLLGTVVPTIDLLRKELIADDSREGVRLVKPISHRPTLTQGEVLSYEVVYAQLQTELQKRFPTEVRFRKPQFHVKGNRMHFTLDRITGSHYEICFRRDYYEFALHFQSTPAVSLARRQAFDPYIPELTRELGHMVRSGKLENKGWMRVWIQLNPEPITSQKVEFYTDLFARFVAVTFPILKQAFEQNASGGYKGL